MQMQNKNLCQHFMSQVEQHNIIIDMSIYNNNIKKELIFSLQYVVMSMLLWHKV